MIVCFSLVIIGKATFLEVSTFLLVVGVAGLVSSFSTFLMWALVIIGIIGLIWGYLDKSKNIIK